MQRAQELIGVRMIDIGDFEVNQALLHICSTRRLVGRTHLLQTPCQMKNLRKLRKTLYFVSCYFPWEHVRKPISGKSIRVLEKSFQEQRHTSPGE